MRMQLCPIAATFALLGSVSLAAAQSAPRTVVQNPDAAMWRPT
jgi:hypothetical protein